MKTKFMPLWAVLVLTALLAGAASAELPTYAIFEIGLIDPGDYGSQGFDVSTLGGYATGRNLGNNNQAILWTEDTGLVPLPNLSGWNYAAGNGVNFHGVVVGTGATTFYGSNPVPLIWEDGVVSALPLPAGQSIGRAEAINNLGVAVGSVNGGSLQQGAYYEGGSGFLVTQTTPEGADCTTLFDVNDAGLAVGTGTDPANAARNVGYCLNLATGEAFEVGWVTGTNGALCFGVSEAGHVVGSTMMNQGSGMPFIWTETDGMTALPLLPGASVGGADGVNSDGWVVGTQGGVYAMPFLWDGEEIYHVADLLPEGSGWDLSTNTSSSAEAISDDGIIVGTGIREGVTSAYALVPDNAVPLLLQEFTAEGRNDGIALAWRLRLVDGDEPLLLERSAAMEGPWESLAAPSADGSLVDADTESGLTYYYRLSVAGQGGDSYVLGYTSGQRIGIAGLALDPAAPNPTAGETRLAYRLPQGQNVQITVHDLRGRLIRSLVQGAGGEGEHVVMWDGRDGQGRQAPAGVYFVNMKTDQGDLTRRVVLTR